MPVLRSLAVVVAAVLSAAPAAAQCEITGEVPQAIRSVICNIATSVHGGDAPVNALTLIVSRPVAAQIRAETVDAEDMLLTLLAAWQNTRQVDVARVEVFYGRAHLATARTHVFRQPSVTFH